MMNTMYGLFGGGGIRIVVVVRCCLKSRIRVLQPGYITIWINLLQTSTYSSEKFVFTPRAMVFKTLLNGLTLATLKKNDVVSHPANP